MGLSFAYGIFHAARPGHGKAVISRTSSPTRRLEARVALSFASALVQALVAVLVLGSPRRCSAPPTAKT